MNDQFSQEPEEFGEANSELDFQELESMEAPGWGTGISFAAGVSLVATVYVTVAT